MKNCFLQPSNATDEFHKKDTKLNIKHTSWYGNDRIYKEVPLTSTQTVTDRFLRSPTPKLFSIIADNFTTRTLPGLK